MAKKSYGAAAKEYFASKGMKFSLPKKDSEDYKAIKALMSESSGAAAMAAGDATANSAVSAQAAPLEKKVKRVYKKREKAAPAPGPSQDSPVKLGGTTIIDQPHVTAQALAKIEENPEEKPKKKRAPRAVQRDGETPQQNLLNANADTNSSMHIVPAAFPGLKEQIAKVLEVKPEGIPERKKKREMPEMMVSKTTEGKRTDDPAGVAGRAPFSFQAIRHILRQ